MVEDQDLLEIGILNSAHRQRLLQAIRLLPRVSTAANQSPTRTIQTHGRHFININFHAHFINSLSVLGEKYKTISLIFDIERAHLYLSANLFSLL